MGALLLMPARLGMPPFVVDDMALKSLLGHLVFGLILGIVAGSLLHSHTTRP